MKKRNVAAATLAIMLGLTACSTGTVTSPTAGSTKSITIGSIHPLTGGLAGAGVLMNDAAKMAVSDINAAGGIKSMGGAKLVLAQGDSQGKADIGQSEAQRLISAGAVALVGPYQSDVAQNVSAAAERAKVPFIIDVAVDDKILSQGHKYTFRIQPDATAMGTSGADSLLAIAKASGTSVKTVSYIHIEGAFGQSVFNAFKAEASAKGLTVVKEVTYAGGISDVTTQVAEALAAKPDVVVVTGYFPDNLLIAKAIKALSPNIKALYGIASGAYDDNSFPPAAGAAGTNVLSANYHYNAASSRVADIRKRFMAKYGKSMETASVLSYQAVEVIAAGLEKAKSADPTRLRNAIAGLSLTDPLLAFAGPIKFDSRGQNINATVVVMQVQNGVVEQVFPTKLATKGVIFPAIGGK